MPSVVTLPSAPNSGLANLGQVIAGHAADYAARARQDQVEARRRAERLADVASDREYVRTEGDRRHTLNRTERLADVASDREYSEEEGNRLYNRSRDATLDDRDDARTYAQGVAILENARKLAERAPFEKNLQRVVDDAASQLTQVDAREREVSSVVMSSPPYVNPNGKEVRDLAQQMAGGSKKKADIDAQVPQALEQLQGEAMFRHATRVKAAAEVLQMLKTARTQLTDMVQTGIQKNVAPSITPPPVSTTGLLSAPEQPMKAVTGQEIAGAVDQMLNTRRPTGAQGQAAPAPMAPRFENPTANPVIAAGNAELATRQSAIESANLNRLDVQLAAIDKQLKEVSAPRQPSLGMGLGGYSVTQYSDPVAAASQATRLLQQRAALENEKLQLQNRLQDTPAAPVSPPTFQFPSGGFRQPNRLLQMTP